MENTASEPTFHFLEIIDPAQVEALRGDPSLRATPCVSDGGRIRAVALIITAVVEGKVAYISTADGNGADVWVKDEAWFEEMFQNLLPFPRSVPWSLLPEFLKAEFEDLPSLVSGDPTSGPQPFPGHELVATPWW